MLLRDALSRWFMEQHPVPQNISGFQFKLIGDITLKQFAYLAGGVILGYLSLKFSLIPSLLRWPLGGFWVLFGFGLAFLPIEERPLDRWVVAFFKRIYSPTQYVWKKQNLPPEVLIMQTVAVPPTTITPQLSKTIPPVAPPPKPTPSPVKQTPPVRLPFRPASPPPPPPPPPPRPVPKVSPAAPVKTDNKSWWTMGAPPKNIPSPAPLSAGSPSVTGKRVVFEEKGKAPPVATQPVVDAKRVEKIKADYQQLEKRFNEQIKSLQTELQQGSIAKDRFIELQQVLSQLLNEKERLSQELIRLRQQLEAKQVSDTVKPTEYKLVPEESRTTVKIVPPKSAVQVGIPTLTTQANVVTGIIKDSQGNLLPGLIVTVKDKEGIPVRALKSNKLGQFAASTPLSSGTYVIEVEDPKHAMQFNRIEVDLTNQVLPPLEISAISQRDVVRQKLTRELFGRNGI